MIARKHVVVALSADGGDELFAGYPRHIKSRDHINKLKLLPPGVRKLASSFLPDSIQTLDRPNRRDKLTSAFNFVVSTIIVSSSPSPSPVRFSEYHSVRKRYHSTFKKHT